MADGSYENAADTKNILAEPPSYKVILINDDYTTQDFVTELLIKVFQKTEQEALEIMWQVHREGTGIAGIYSYDVAASKVQLTIQMARGKGFPLQAIYERI
jgi:ATP-dependent Clp protease adaptor protein ClpS